VTSLPGARLPLIPFTCSLTVTEPPLLRSINPADRLALPDVYGPAAGDR
jgi:hypothetical protein